ncbi:MAG TPA: thioesterase family protein [Flavitalea sp.]|nr:thioesterase family protein [Flavitalea sp.]
MARIKIDLPEKFHFTAVIPVRITDLNYGGHVGNDSVLSLIHEARVQFLKHYGYSEMDIGGAGLIMSEASVSFKQEIFYGDIVRIHVSVSDISRVSFTLYYKLEKEAGGKTTTIAHAQTGMACFDYRLRKPAPVPEEALLKWKE